ncbi:hypothetical protein J6590_104527, partial [Homalodisca vitripennis]
NHILRRLTRLVCWLGLRGWLLLGPAVAAGRFAKSQTAGVDEQQSSLGRGGGRWRWPGSRMWCVGRTGTRFSSGWLS